MIKKPYPGQAGFTLDSFFPPKYPEYKGPGIFLLYTPTGYKMTPILHKYPLILPIKYTGYRALTQFAATLIVDA